MDAVRDRWTVRAALDVDAGSEEAKGLLEEPAFTRWEVWTPGSAVPVASGHGTPNGLTVSSQGHLSAAAPERQLRTPAPEPLRAVAPLRAPSDTDNIDFHRAAAAYAHCGPAPRGPAC